MGNCVKKPIKPKVCDLIAISTVSGAVKLSSKLYSGIHEAFQFVRIIGHGQFGTVREAVRKNQENGQRYAVKSIVKQEFYKHRQMMKREIEIMMFADHPNIIRLFETFEDQLYLHLVMELCTGGDVCERLITQGSYTEKEASVILKQLLSAVNYLHSQNVVHRDLKAENFLYENRESQIIKICDFGMSIQSENLTKLKSLAGTPYYLAPEVLKGSYTKACDVWSLGVFLYFLLTGKHPFKGNSLESVYNKAADGFKSLNLDNLPRISESAKDLVRRMLTVQESKRISIKSALRHPWLQNHRQTHEIPLNVFKSLTKFKAKNLLMKEALKVVVKHLSSSQISNLRSAFLEIDSENDGFITAASLKKAMNVNGFNLASEEIDQVIENCSYVGEGKIRFSEFLVATVNRKALLDAEVVWEAFQMFDTNATGKVHVSNLRYALMTVGCEIFEDEFKELIQEVRLDADYCLDFEGFQRLLRYFEEESVSRDSGSRKVTLVKKLSKDFRIKGLANERRY